LPYAVYFIIFGAISFIFKRGCTEEWWGGGDIQDIDGIQDIQYQVVIPMLIGGTQAITFAVWRKAPFLSTVLGLLLDLFIELLLCVLTAIIEIIECDNTNYEKKALEAIVSKQTGRVNSSSS
jgi:ABC-type transport system involved in cytochrome bd biosynthesis fused ATPase/permease subunit